MIYSKHNIECVMDWLHEQSHECRQSDPDSGLFANDEMADMFDYLGSVIEDVNEMNFTQLRQQLTALQAEKERLAGEVERLRPLERVMSLIATQMNLFGSLKNGTNIQMTTMAPACAHCAEVMDTKTPPRSRPMLTPKQNKDNALIRKCIDEHWKPMREGTHKEGESPDGEYCFLCDEYPEENCDGCPVKEKTGEAYCAKTPYSKARFAWDDFEDGLEPDRSILEAAFDKEIEFLESLIVVEEEQSDGN